MDFIPVCKPFLDGNELSYVKEAVETGWISSSGKYVQKFEEKFAEYCNVKYGVSVCNGTAALHLALKALDIGLGDEVIIPNFTMIATAFAVCYTGAMPIFVDAEMGTWNIDPDRIEAKITDKTKAILLVSIFGHPCDMNKIRKIGDKYNLKIIEDAAESHGAEYENKKVGSLADITAFSFFANKNLTTGEGGMVVTDNFEYFENLKFYKNLCFSLDNNRNYVHHEIGFNYRMSNIHAAIGLAQTERADYYRDLRINNSKIYRSRLSSIPGIKLQEIKNNVLCVYWMNGLAVDEELFGHNRDSLMEFLKSKGIDSRLFFVGMNKQPALRKYGCTDNDEYEVTDYLSKNGMYLPSASDLTIDEINYICDQIEDYQKRR